MNIKSLSGADLARCFGVDRSMVTRWKKAGMPEEKGLFNLPLCIKWRLEREADAMAPKEGASTEGEKWLTAFRRERARTARLERKKLEESLYPREEVYSAWTAQILECRKGLLGFGSRLPPALEGKSIPAMRDIIETEVRALLTSFARKGKYTPAGKTEKPAKKAEIPAEQKKILEEKNAERNVGKSERGTLRSGEKLGNPGQKGTPKKR